MRIGPLPTTTTASRSTHAHLVALAAREIVVRRLGRKLGRGGIDHAKAGEPVRPRPRSRCVSPHSSGLPAVSRRRVDAQTLFQARRDRRTRSAKSGRSTKVRRCARSHRAGRWHRIARETCRDAAARRPRRAARASASRRRLRVRRRSTRRSAPVSVSTLEIEAADRLDQRGAERAADAHRFAGRFHLRSQTRVGERKLVERPARNLDDDVVERRLVRGFGDAGDRDWESRRASVRARCASKSWRSDSRWLSRRAPNSAKRAG